MDGFVGPSEHIYLVSDLYDNTLRQCLVERELEQSEILLILSDTLRGLKVIN